MNLEIDLEDDRVLKEIALFADRSDITEELTRLKSHVSQFKQFTESPDSIDENGFYLYRNVPRDEYYFQQDSTNRSIKNIIEGK